MVMQRVAPAANASHEPMGTSVVNRNMTPASIPEIGRDSLSLCVVRRCVQRRRHRLGRLRARNWIRAGCDSHWPLCNGELLPVTSQAQTVIEFTHRATGALSLVLVATFLIWSWRRIAVILLRGKFGRPYACGATFSHFTPPPSFRTTPFQ